MSNKSNTHISLFNADQILNFWGNLIFSADPAYHRQMLE